MWMGDALGEESVIKDDVIHSNRALSEGMITIAGNADGLTHAMWGKSGRWNESSIDPRRWAIVSISAVWSAAGRLLLGRRWPSDLKWWSNRLNSYGTFQRIFSKPSVRLIQIWRNWKKRSQAKLDLERYRTHSTSAEIFCDWQIVGWTLKNCGLFISPNLTCDLVSVRSPSCLTVEKL